MMESHDISELINNLIPKVESSVPETGDFTQVYSEYKNKDRSSCLTDVMLKVEPLPKHIEDYANYRYLTCVGYKLPAPIKSSCILLKGNKAEILKLLYDESLVERLKSVIKNLSDNLADV